MSGESSANAAKQRSTTKSPSLLDEKRAEPAKKKQRKADAATATTTPHQKDDETPTAVTNSASAATAARVNNNGDIGGSHIMFSPDTTNVVAQVDCSGTTHEANPEHHGIAQRLLKLLTPRDDVQNNDEDVEGSELQQDFDDDALNNPDLFLDGNNQIDLSTGQDGEGGQQQELIQCLLELCEGMSDADVARCWDYLTKWAKARGEDGLDIALLAQYRSAEHLLECVKHWEEPNQRYRLREYPTVSAKLEQKTIDDGPGDDTHLIKAVETTQNVEKVECFCEEIMCLPEEELKSHECFGHGKGVYLLLFGRERAFDDDLRQRLRDEIESLELPDEEVEKIEKIFESVWDDTPDEEDRSNLLRVKIGNILEEYLFKRMKNLHASLGMFGHVIFIATNDLCDDKVTALEDMLKYAGSRFERMTCKGHGKSCLAGTNGEVFYLRQWQIDALQEQALNFVKNGKFTIKFDDSVFGGTVCIKETDIYNDDNEHWCQFRLKSDRKYHRKNCIYRNGPSAFWKRYASSLYMKCECTRPVEEDEQEQDAHGQEQDGSPLPAQDSAAKIGDEDEVIEGEAGSGGIGQRAAV